MAGLIWEHFLFLLEEETGKNTGDGHEGALEDQLALLPVSARFGLGDAQMRLLRGADDPLEHVAELPQLCADRDGHLYAQILSNLHQEQGPIISAPASLSRH